MKCEICGGTKYTDALKKYNAGKPAWCLPRKGTELHAEVLRIMNAPKKPVRKLRKPPTESVTNLGKETQKRIQESTRIEPVTSMEKPTRKLRKAPAPVKVLKPGECPHCGKIFKNLNQHITKSHLKLHLEFKYDEKYNDYLMKVTDQDGKILTNWTGPDSGNTGEDGIFFFDMGDNDDGYNVSVDYITKEVKVEVSKRLKNGEFREGTAFKNWDAKFVR